MAILYLPINTLKPFAKNIWIVDGEAISFYGLPFTTRMTIIRLKNKDLIIHSPIKPTESLIKEINKLGKVAHIISPNKIHYWYIAEFQKYYPKAVTWASPGVRQRAKQYRKEIIFDQNLEIDSPLAWQEEIDQTIILGSRFLEEVIFFHKETKTMIVTDIIENFEAKKISLFFRILTWLAGALSPKGGTTIDQQLLFLGNKEKLKYSIDKIFAWQQEKVIISHGKYLTENVPQELKRIFKWVK